MWYRTFQERERFEWGWDRPITGVVKGHPIGVSAEYPWHRQMEDIRTGNTPSEVAQRQGLKAYKVKVGAGSVKQQAP